ncbi:MAG: hypothetical protein HY868_12145 [Chloroflexi bacterium]|nr:hypothetical protein [Chloroflexota bacterium]
MKRIEVWKSKSDWQVKSQPEQAKIRRHTARLVKTMSDRGLVEEGPFWIENTWGSLLVWTAEDNAENLKPHERTRLREHFEPLTFVSLTDYASAKQLADKLAR